MMTTIIGLRLVLVLRLTLMLRVLLSRIEVEAMG
jgi:hypothetical protein